MNAIKKLLFSFKYAINGLFFCIKTCRNFRIHTVAAALVLYFIRFYNLNGTQKSIIYLIIGLVLALECINSAIEQLCNEVRRDYSPLIKRAKDVAACAVLCMTVTSVAIAYKLLWDKQVFLDIYNYFSSPVRLIILIVFAVLAVIYIFYEDIFKNAKK